MSRGAPFTTDWLGTSPLHLTAKFGKLDTSEVLLRAGCSRDARTKVDKTPLHVAAQEGHPEICELLLEHGSDVDAGDMLRMTPLHWAVERGCCATVEILLRHGANTNIVSKFDKTPLEIASENGRPDIFEILQNSENLRMLAIDNGGGGDIGEVGHQNNLIISQQEVVSSGPGQFVGHTLGVGGLQKKTLHISNTFPIVKSEIENHSDPIPLQINLDPVQIALNSVGEGGISDMSEMESAQDEAIKLLASHGITMLPEDSPTLTLTEAGKLALSSSNKVTTSNIITASNIKTMSPISRTTSVPRITKLVTLKTSPIKNEKITMIPPIKSSPMTVSNSMPDAAENGSGQNKPIRVIKLTPAQAEAFKRSRAAGQIMFTKDKLLSSPGSNSVSTQESGINKENGNILNTNNASPVNMDEPSSKVIKLENGNRLATSKEELQKKLQLQLKQKAEEAERLKQETKKREEECEKLKAQLDALSQ